MHRLAATPGGWTPDTEGVIFIAQTPAPIVFLTAADTEIQCLAAMAQTPIAGFPAVRVANLLQLQQQLAIDTYGDEVLHAARIIILRLLGGRAYWSYGLEVTQEIAAATGANLIVLPGDDLPDPELMAHSTVPLGIAHHLWRYLTAGGVDNLRHGLMWVCDRYLDTQFHPPAPIPVPKIGMFPYPGKLPANNGKGIVGILFYRAHYLAGNTTPITALCDALYDRGFIPRPIYLSSLQDPDIQAELLDYLTSQTRPGIDLLLNTTSFAMARLDAGEPQLNLWKTLDVPVLQVILSGGTQDNWAQNPMGLGPRDIAMNVALPEVDGRIITRAVSFKAAVAWNPDLETEVVTYQPVSDRIQFVADLTANWVKLRHTPISERRIALILANYPTRDGRLANGVGLDTPQSCVEILRAMRTAGYTVSPIPQNGDELIQWLTATSVTNDPESHPFRPISQAFSLTEYIHFWRQLPAAVQQGITHRWGSPETELTQWGGRSLTAIPIPGLQLGNVFIGVQPSRGYDRDPALNYHAPDLEPTHAYLAFYGWLRERFGAQAIVHVGKHGNLEWLPGKGVSLSPDCYPEAAFGSLPHLYPFIVNDPGEGAQAKRRAQAAIIDHLTPPLTRAELYGDLQTLEGWVDEYYEAQSLDPTRLPQIRDRILTLLQDTALLEDLNPALIQTSDHFAELLPSVDSYLCELKEAQIRDGLHIFGRCPESQQLYDLVVAIARHPSGDRQGLTRAIAADWQLGQDPLTDDWSSAWTLPDEHQVPAAIAPRLVDCRTWGHVVEVLEQSASEWVAQIAIAGESTQLSAETHPIFEEATPKIRHELTWITNTLLPALRQTHQEIEALLHGLDGHYVPSGPAGAPTRNRPDVLPTGRNFYTVDIRAIPTESAWDVGRKAAETLVERYTQDHGEYPQAIGLSVWGTATMRTGGDDLAQALALLGVQPVWDGPSRRVVDFEILPISLLGRPRVDVTLRISGFFRDAFPNLIDLFDQAVAAVAKLPESSEENPLAAKVATETDYWQAQGLSPEQATARSHYRIFGSKPGAYGAGLQGLIDAQNWVSDRDLAQAYMQWSSYAYGRQAQGKSAPEAFQARLGQIQVVLHNQDNREHDLLDSDDYYQFQGGLTAAVRAISERQPQVYFGDHSLTEQPKVRSLSEEIARVYRSRVINPKWIAGVQRHGYKGAFEMAATLDYLFAYDATTHCVADHMYTGIAQAYLLDENTRQFVQRVNPWALRDMAERLLEAHQRRLWTTASDDLVEALRAIAHAAEADLEARQNPTLS
jgi:cobaltochelatase CobN